MRTHQEARAADGADVASGGVGGVDGGEDGDGRRGCVGGPVPGPVVCCWAGRRTGPGGRSVLCSGRRAAAGAAAADLRHTERSNKYRPIQ